MARKDTVMCLLFVWLVMFNMTVEMTDNLEVSFDGKAESKTLDLITEFVPSIEWQRITSDTPLPPGLHIKIDMTTGDKWAKLIVDETAVILPTGGDLVSVNPPNELDDMPGKHGAMLRAFRQLPTEEIERLSIERLPEMSDAEYEAKLDGVWLQRQNEIKIAYDAMLIPVDLFSDAVILLGENSQALRTNPHDPSSILQVIDNIILRLSFLLDDIDNTRDFHTVNGFPALFTVLDAIADMNPRTSQSTKVLANGIRLVATSLNNVIEFREYLTEFDFLTLFSRVVDSNLLGNEVKDVFVPILSLLTSTCIPNPLCITEDRFSDFNNLILRILELNNRNYSNDNYFKVNRSLWNLMSDWISFGRSEHLAEKWIDIVLQTWKNVGVAQIIAGERIELNSLVNVSELMMAMLKNQLELKRAMCAVLLKLDGIEEEEEQLSRSWNSCRLDEN